MLNVLALVLSLIVAGAAQAEDTAASRDPARGTWFKSLKQPATGHSCCDISDCRQTQAEQLDDGSWKAIVNGTWRSIPPGKVLPKPLSIDGEAYVCNAPDRASGPAAINGTGAVIDLPMTPGIIYCFVPPVPGF